MRSSSTSRGVGSAVIGRLLKARAATDIEHRERDTRLDLLTQPRQGQRSRLTIGSVTQDRDVSIKMLAHVLLIALPFGVSRRKHTEQLREVRLAGFDAAAAAVVVLEPWSVQAWCVNASPFKLGEHVSLQHVRRLGHRRDDPPRCPREAGTLKSVHLRPVQPEHDRRVGWIAMLLKPGSRKVALKDSRARVDTRVPEEP